MNRFLIFFLLVRSLQSCQNASVQAPPLPPPKLIDGGLNAAILALDGANNAELTAPMDVFRRTRSIEGIRPMNVFTVAEKRQPIRTFEGLQILPDFDFESVPPINILVVPSSKDRSMPDSKNERLTEFLKRSGAEASLVIGLGVGSFELAQASLLNGLVCTVGLDETEAFRARFPKIHCAEEVSFVHDGKAVTSQGGARSFEAALYVAERFYGPMAARRIASELALDWDLEDVPSIHPEIEER